MTDKESYTGKFFTNYSFEYPKENVVVATSSFQEVPSNEKPLINLTMNGILRPSEEKVHEIKMIFKENDIPEKDFLAQSYGTFVLCKGVYNARRIIKTRWDKEKSTLKILIDLTRQKVRLKRPAQFSFSIQINDSNLPSTCRNSGKKTSNGKSLVYCATPKNSSDCVIATPVLWGNYCKTNKITPNSCASSKEYWSNYKGKLTCKKDPSPPPRPLPLDPI